MKRHALSFVLVLSATSAGFAVDSPASNDDEGELREQVRRWIHERDNFSFTGTIEFELIRRSAPDPDRAQDLPLLTDDALKVSTDPVQDAQNLEKLAFQREFVQEWASNGIEVIQGWRISARGNREIRAEVSYGYLRPAAPRHADDPVLSVVVSDGALAWEWNNKTNHIFHNQPPTTPPVNTATLDQARCELRDIFVSRRSWLLEGKMVSVTKRDNQIVAEFAGASDDRKRPWQARLEFEQRNRELLLSRATVERDGYHFEEILSDYRLVGGNQIIPHRHISQYGPIEELEKGRRGFEEVKEYIIRFVEDTPPAPALFDMPADARSRGPEETTFTYEDITGPGRTPFLIDVPR